MRYAVGQNELDHVAIHTADGNVWNREMRENDVSLQDIPHTLPPE